MAQEGILVHMPTHACLILQDVKSPGGGATSGKALKTALGHTIGDSVLWCLKLMMTTGRRCYLSTACVKEHLLRGVLCRGSPPWVTAMKSED